MKFYNSVGPNPRMVRMFMAEKGFDVPKVDVDLRGGEKLTLADIFLFAFVDFMKAVGQQLDPANKNLTAWFERMKARPSAAA